MHKIVSPYCICASNFTIDFSNKNVFRQGLPKKRVELEIETLERVVLYLKGSGKTVFEPLKLGVTF